MDGEDYIKAIEKVEKIIAQIDKKLEKHREDVSMCAFIEQIREIYLNEAREQIENNEFEVD